MWKLDSNGNTLRRMGDMGFTHLAAGTSENDVHKKQKIRLVLAFYGPSTETDRVSTIQYLDGQFGSKEFDGKNGLLVDFPNLYQFRKYASNLNIKMCPPTRLSGYN
jgi:hypothetical protein